MRPINFFAIASILISGCIPSEQKPEIELPEDSGFNFIVISDHGRNGYENQQEVADMMGKVADECDIRFIVTGGDNFQTNGVQSTSDPLWRTSFEDIYRNPSLLVDWYPALGNHDHSGNIQAEVDYSSVSRRWRMPAPYYTLVKSRDSVSIRLVIIDTYPMIEGFSDPEDNVQFEKAQRQVEWVDSVLTVEKEDWVIVVGHHPVFSAHPTRNNTEELVKYLNPVLNKHKVDFFIGAHDHIFQHLRDKGSDIDYFVNTAGSSVRDASSNDMTVFSASAPGFSICSATTKSLSIYFINEKGKAIYSYSRSR
jgi:metallophosphoesterase superfamily enzyme